MVWVLAVFSVVYIGTHPNSQEPEPVVPQPVTIEVKQADTFVAECTAYTAGYESTGKTPDNPAYGITASGRKVREGMIAADTSVLPFGTKVWIEGLGVFVVEDTGGAIVGNRIDIYMDSLDEAVEFGRQSRKVIILER